MKRAQLKIRNQTIDKTLAEPTGVVKKHTKKQKQKQNKQTKQTNKET